MTKIFSKFYAAVTPACRQAGFFVTFFWWQQKKVNTVPSGGCW
jgi:hypothetical protein